jgi:hypothetical protein
MGPIHRLQQNEVMRIWLLMLWLVQTLVDFLYYEGGAASLPILLDK